MKDIVVKISVDKLDFPIHKLRIVFTKKGVKKWVKKNLPKKYNSCPNKDWDAAGICFTYYDKIYGIVPFHKNMIDFELLMHELNHMIQKFIRLNYSDDIDKEEITSQLIGYISSAIMKEIQERNIKVVYHTSSQIKTNLHYRI